MRNNCEFITIENFDKKLIKIFDNIYYKYITKIDYAIDNI